MAESRGPRTRSGRRDRHRTSDDAPRESGTFDALRESGTYDAPRESPRDVEGRERQEAGGDASGASVKHAEEVRAGASSESESEAARRHDGRSVTDLLGRLGSETATLARQDIELAKAEMREKLGTLRRGGILLAVGTAVLLVALLPLVETVVRGLTALFEGWMGLEIAVWLAPLVVALVVGALGYALIRIATGSIREERLIPEKTAESLRRQQRWMRSRVRELREEA